MPDGETTVLFRGLPAHSRFASDEKLALKRFAAVLADRLADGKAFTCLVTNDGALRKLNSDFLGNDYATDVLSFPSTDSGSGLGDLAISAERADLQARQYGHERVDEVRILMLHGVLHLTGMDHEHDKGVMARTERKLRAELGLPSSLIQRTQKVRGGQRK